MHKHKADQLCGCVAATPTTTLKLNGQTGKAAAVAIAELFVILVNVLNFACHTNRQTHIHANIGPHAMTNWKALSMAATATQILLLSTYAHKPIHTHTDSHACECVCEQHKIK